MANYQNFDRVQALKAELDALPPMSPEAEARLWQKFRLEWNYNSNHMEGNTLTYGETKLLLIQGKTTGNHDMREYEEMKAHDVAVGQVREWAEDDRPLRESDVRGLNQLLLVEPFYAPAQTPEGNPTRRKIIPGQYKTDPNHVRLPNGELFHYATPDEVGPQMRELLDWYNKPNKDTEGPNVGTILHYRFVLIHPFDDGNGRTARLLMNYHLLKLGYPPVVIPSDEKKRYLDALQRADAGDYSVLIDYVLEKLVRSLELALRAARGESVEEGADWSKELTLLKRKADAAVRSKKQSELDHYQRTLRDLPGYLSTYLRVIVDQYAPFAQFFDEAKLTVEVDNSNPFFAFSSRRDLEHTSETDIEREAKELTGALSQNKGVQGLCVVIFCNFKGFKYPVGAFPGASGTFKIKFLHEETIFYPEAIEPSLHNPPGEKLLPEELYFVNDAARSLKKMIERYLKSL